MCAMANYRRSRIELYIDVLRAIHNGRASPSRVVYAANLSYDRVTRCINFLEEHDLVRRIEGERKRYAVTERGSELIKYFNEVETSLFYNKKTSPNISIHYGGEQV